MTLGSLDPNGIGRYEETTPVGTKFSDYLNLALDAVTRVLGRPQQFADATAQAAFTGARVGDLAYRVDLAVTMRYDGASWVAWESDWKTYTATLSAAGGTFAIGSGGSQSTRYRYEHGRIRVKFKFVLGTSGASMGTAPKFTLPVTAVSPPHSNAAYVAGSLGGTILDASAGVARLLTVLSDDTSATVVRLFYLDNVAGLLSSPTATAPWTWAASDALQGEFVYDPA
ncbi:MAG TPA: hypothetical protein VL043_04600 [Protaetiibacter sp.]|nr:hypothetical protein [Protaetiibacter sp.]